MTRDQAIELRLEHIGERTKAVMRGDTLHEIAAAEVDFYIATGMLKLDEPKSERDALLEIVRRHTSFDQARCIENAFARLVMIAR